MGTRVGIRPQLRPLRRIARGRWETRDGRFAIHSGESHGAEGSNRDYWHVWENRGDRPDAYGEREATLTDSVEALEANDYGNLRAAPADARERIIRAIEFDGEPCAITDVKRSAGLAPEQVDAWVAHMAWEGTLLDTDKGLRLP